MTRTKRIAIGLIASLLVAPAGFADDEFEVRWSATFQAIIKDFENTETDDDRTGFFDQYEYTPNKSSDPPLQLGIREAELDLFGDQHTPLLHFDLDSPTSTLGVTGDDIDRPFLNQRASLLAGPRDGIHVDVDYRRFRTDELRFFSLAGPDLVLDEDRFYTERTGFEGELQLWPARLADPPAALEWLAPGLSARGGWQERDGKRQTGFLSNNFQRGTVTQDLEENLAEVGGTLLVAPGGLLTLAFDFDHEQFRQHEAPIIEGTVGSIFPAASRSTIGFIPDTDRYTGSARFNSRIGDRATLEGGFQVSRLKQVGTRTPEEQIFGLDDNHLTFYSGNFGATVEILDGFSAHALFKYDRRNNNINHDSLLFDTNSQVAEFLDHWTRIVAGFELMYRPMRLGRLAVGGRAEFIDRDLDFAATRSPNTSAAGNPNGRIVPANALMADKTEMWTVYGRMNVRPVRGLSLSGEVGYRFAPKTGYIVDLDNYIYGKGRVSYTLPLKRPVVISAFGQGGSGRNRDFDMTSGIGPNPTGGEVNRDFDRDSYRWGVSLSASPVKKVSLFASYFASRDAQDYDFILSYRNNNGNLVGGQRYQQDRMNNSRNTIFAANDPINYRGKNATALAGVSWQATKATDAGLTYAFTQARTSYGTTGLNSALMHTNSKIRSSIHGFYFDVGHWLIDGLRGSVGYRYDLIDDDSTIPSPTTSRIRPFGLSAHQHTVTVGLTLTSDLLSGD